MMLLAGNTFVSNTDVVRFRHLKMWAERGLIHVEDTRNGEYKVIAVRTVLERMQAIQDMLRNSKASQRQKHSEDQFDSAKLLEEQRMLESMIELVRKAQVQGMPSDASARRDLVRRRPTTILVPGAGSVM